MTIGTEPLARELIAEKIEQVDALDTVAEPLQKAVQTVVPQDSVLKDVLSGTWLGHPVHPPLTDVVIGAWTSALALDLVGGDETDKAAERLIGIGILAAVPTALTGASDWADVRGGDRRIGTVHALGNTTALVLHTLSWAARKRGHRTRGVALSAIVYGVATFSAYRSFRTVSRRLVVIPADDRIGRILLLDDAVRCRCHGSTFRLEDGAIVKGPATAPQPAYDARESDGAIQVRARQEA